MDAHLLLLMQAANSGVRCEFCVDSYGVALDGIAAGLLQWDAHSVTTVRVAGQSQGFALTEKGKATPSS